MSEKDNFALVRAPLSTVEKAGARRIQYAIVADTLALAKRQQPTIVAATIRIGRHEWCKPDYRQIHAWAKALGLEPEEVIERLLQGRRRIGKSIFGQTRFESGRLLEICWDFDLLPLWKFELVEALETTHMSFYTGLNDHLPFGDMQVPELCLSRLLELEMLSCDCNGLPTLDLSGVPKLTKLHCAQNEIQDLNLRAVPRLTELSCWANQLSKLDLSGNPRLDFLVCGNNQIQELSLTGLSGLHTLYCGSNGLSKLDLSDVPNLIRLGCKGNEIQDLDLSKVPRLTLLDCSCNPINVLDIRPLARLKELHYDAETTHLLQRPDQHFEA